MQKFLYETSYLTTFIEHLLATGTKELAYFSKY